MHPRKRKRKLEEETTSQDKINNEAIKALFDSKIEHPIFKKFVYRLYDKFHNAVNKTNTFQFTNVDHKEYKYLNQKLTKEEKELLGLTLNYDDKRKRCSFVIDSSKGKLISQLVAEYYLSNDRLKAPEQEEQLPGYQVPIPTMVFASDFTEVEQTDKEPEITFFNDVWFNESEQTPLPIHQVPAQTECASTVFTEPDQTSTDPSLQVDIDALIAHDNGVNFDFPEQTSAEESKSDITSEGNSEFNIEIFFYSKINDWEFKNFLDRLNSIMEIFGDIRKSIRKSLTVSVTTEIYEYFKNLIEKEPRIERYLKIQLNTNYSHFIEININAALELNRLSGPYLVKQKLYVSEKIVLSKYNVNRSKLFQNSKVVPPESPGNALDREWQEFLRKHI